MRRADSARVHSGSYEADRFASLLRVLVLRERAGQGTIAWSFVLLDVAIKFGKSSVPVVQSSDVLCLLFQPAPSCGSRVTGIFKVSVADDV